MLNELKDLFHEENLLDEAVGLDEVETKFEDDEGIEDSDDDFDRRWYGE